MRWIVPILREIYGLFVDDQGFALAILAWLAVAALLVTFAPLPAPVQGPLLFAGLAALLIRACLHAARGRC